MHTTIHTFRFKLYLLFIVFSTLFSTRIIAQINEGDSLALVAFYHSTNGDDWDNNTNWLVEGQSVEDWYGISTYGSRVGEIDLRDNGLTGEIPAAISSLTGMQYLFLSDNQLTGSLPPELALGGLEYLYLDNNQLTGNIPPEIANTYILYIRLQNNQFTGSIPPGFLQQPNPMLYTYELNLSNNQFTGNIPAPIPSGGGIGKFYASNNQLTGNIPPEFGEASTKEFDVSNNQLTGSIPPELTDINNIKVFNVANNQLTGDIPFAFGEEGFLILFDVSNNQLTGPIPLGLGSASTLTTFNLSNNQLEGFLPKGLASPPGLTTLLLNNNQFSGCYPPEYAGICGLPEVDFSGNPDLPNGGDLSVFCATGDGTCTSLVGQIVFDENGNCAFDSDEIPLENWRVKATSVDGTLYGISDENGYYQIYTYLGEYQLELFPPPYAPYWEEDCTGTPIITIVDLLETDTVNFYPNTLVDCPYLTVDMSTPFLRRCFENTYYVTYCNQGTISAEDAYVEIAFDDLIDVVSASIPISSQVDNTLVFELGDIAPNQCGTFQIDFTVSCDAVLGQALCAVAHIYPDSICLDPSTEWSGATVEVEVDCEEDLDLVRFTIKNTGDGNMLESESYIVIEDGLILLSGPVPFILDSQQEIVLDFPANGSTYICQAGQVANHPTRSTPIAFVEGCGTNEGGGFSTGYVNQFPEDDNGPFVSVDCQEVVGAYDPNDKKGYPSGYANEHYIDQGQRLEYHIRFQNTGTDTAFTVVIRDEISPYLDINTFRRGSSSHPYSVDILEGNTLVFLFEDILLVDSFTNEPDSHGFVKFEIDQIADVPLETVIENTAAIFFDFNEPVITNTTWHRLGENYILLSAIDDIQLPGLNVSIMPNPMMDQARFQLSGLDFKNAQLSLYNIAGVRLRTEVFYGNEITIERGNLPPGTYIFTVEIDGQQGFVGKVIVQ